MDLKYGQSNEFSKDYHHIKFENEIKYTPM